MAKNILVWLVIGLVLMTVFQSLAPRGASPQEMDYSTFLEMVRDHQVAKVSISEDHTTIAGEKKDGSCGAKTDAPAEAPAEAPAATAAAPSEATPTATATAADATAAKPAETTTKTKSKTKTTKKPKGEGSCGEGTCG